MIGDICLSISLRILLHIHIACPSGSDRSSDLFYKYFLIFICKDDLIVLNFYFTDILLLDHAHKSSIIRFLYLMLHKDWCDNQIKYYQHY